MSAITMSMTIQALSVVDETGLVHLGSLDMYARAEAITEDEADEEIEEALELLVSEGEYEEIRGSYYEVETMREHEREKAEQRREHQRYLDDIAAEYAAAKGF